MRPRYLKAVDEILATSDRFGHREHLELAWIYLAASPIDAAKREMARAIRHPSEMHGGRARYHDTITLSWVQLVAVHRSQSEAASFDDFIAENPALLDRHLLDRHYSSDTLWSEAARRRWIEPDLLALPALA